MLLFHLEEMTNSRISSCKKRRHISPKMNFISFSFILFVFFSGGERDCVGSDNDEIKVVAACFMVTGYCSNVSCSN